MVICYRNESDVQAELRALSALEAQCCPFLDFEIDTDGTRITLQITPSSNAGPEVAGELRLLSEAFVGKR